jgi:hypothetical protein
VVKRVAGCARPAGVRQVTFDWEGMSLRQPGRDTDRIDFLYRIHYLQCGLPNERLSAGEERGTLHVVHQHELVRVGLQVDLSLEVADVLLPHVVAQQGHGDDQR